MLNKNVQFEELGLVDYQKAWDYQKVLFEAAIAAKFAHRKAGGEGPANTTHHLLFCQHPHVYTLGKSGKKEHLLLDETALEKIGATFYPINRGGDITYHGPGQLVGYPILDLDHFFTDIHRYLRLLEEAIILTLNDYGISSGRSKGETGVWLDVGTPNARKICAMGIRASRWVTMHGFAFNIAPQMDYFSYIVPCGIADKEVTSMAQELGYAPDFAEVSQKVKQYLAQLFEFTYYEKQIL
ncbi:MAG: lipoyl(octanoyl) transferase LipB [Schleiferiaceae bacterium]|nr:lipoyl(octanoyl) transferase LipB [Schleiferiaceae bacterium]